VVSPFNDDTTWAPVVSSFEIFQTEPPFPSLFVWLSESNAAPIRRFTSSTVVPRTTFPLTVATQIQGPAAPIGPSVVAGAIWNTSIFRWVNLVIYHP
jgi:hypothetical protein